MTGRVVGVRSASLLLAMDGYYDDLSLPSPAMMAPGLALLAGLLLALLAPALHTAPGPLVVGLALIALLLLVGGCGARHSLSRWWLPGWLLLGCLITTWHAARWQLLELPSACERRPLSVEARIAGMPVPVAIPRDEPLRRVVLELLSVDIPECRGPQRVEVFWGGEADLVPGEAWQLTLRLRRPWGRVNPAGHNPRTDYLARNVHALGSVSRLAVPERVPVRDHWHPGGRLRLALSNAIAAAGESGASGTGLVRALAVADRSAIPAPLWQQFQDFGIAHLLVISGLHVGMVAGLGAALGGLLGRLPRCAGQAGRLAALGGLGVASLYAALAGWSVPTTRAWVMLASSLLAVLAGRSAWAPANLLWAALLLLLYRPFFALSAGFWLSFGAVAGLFWLAQWLRRDSFWSRLGAAHLFISLLMFPLGGLWFGAASLIAPLANFLLVPFTAFAVVPPVLAGVLLWPLWRDAASGCWSLAGYLLEGMVTVMQKLHVAVAGQLSLQLQPTLLAVCLALLALCLTVLPVRLTLRGTGALLFLPLLLPLQVQRVAGPDAVHLLVLDVGQATAVLIHDRQRALLYDTASAGAARSAILPVLQQRGIRRLDTLVVSHGDADHAGGLETLLDELAVGELLLGADLAAEHASGRGRTAAASRAGATVRPCRAGESWRWGETAWFRVLAPAPAERLSSRNAGSCVLQVSLSGYRVLLSGDIDQARERDLVRYWGEALRSDWALAPHHGSGSSSSWVWLKAVRPELVAFSHARANPFGHPPAAVLERHQVLGINTRSTAEHGALEWVLRPGRPPQPKVLRERAPRLWWER